MKRSMRGTLGSVFDDDVVVFFQDNSTTSATSTYGGESVSESTLQCNRGAYFSNVTLSCVPCPPGTYQSSYGQQECMDCPIGTYSSNYGNI
jgi:hypothetical protein